LSSRPVTVATVRRVILGLAFLGCAAESTGTLPADMQTRVTREGVVRSAADVTFRYTEAPGRRSARWEDRLASIVVTPSTILIHKNAKIGLELTPSRRRDIVIERDGRRVRLRAGQGESEVLWSFEPPDGDAAGWTRDLRAVIRASHVYPPER
jgi:hypothetical protein